MNTNLRTTALGGAFLALAPLSAAAPQDAPAPKSAQQSSECTCTCAACQAKHGPKAAAAAQDGEIAEMTALIIGSETELAGELAPSVRNLNRADLDVAQLDALIQAVEAGKNVAIVLDDVTGTTDAEPAAAVQERAYLGISLGGENDGGAMIGAVIDGTAADRGGLKAGDLIVSAEELPVRGAADLLEVLGGLAPGDTATFEIERGDKEMNITVVLGARPAVPGPGASGRLGGIERIQILGADAAEAPSSGFFFSDGFSDSVVEIVEEPELVDTLILEEPIIEDFEISDHNETAVEEEPEIRWVFDTETPIFDSRVNTGRRGGRDLVGDGSVMLLPDGTLVIKPRARAFDPASIAARSDRRTQELRAQISKLEAQVAELQEMLNQMQSELKQKRGRR